MNRSLFHLFVPFNIKPKRSKPSHFKLGYVKALSIGAFNFGNFKAIAFITAIFSTLLLTSCASHPFANFQGETLVQPMPLPEEDWKLFQREIDEPSMVETRWTKDASQDMAQTFVIHFKEGEPATLMHSKNNDDKLGKASCNVSFTSNILSQEKENGYKQLTWESVCEMQAGLYIKTLHKSIVGNESMYLFKRIFRTTPSNEQWQAWLDYTKRITVCDTRTTQHLCPEDLSIGK